MCNARRAINGITSYVVYIQRPAVTALMAHRIAAICVQGLPECATISKAFVQRELRAHNAGMRASYLHVYYRCDRGASYVGAQRSGITAGPMLKGRITQA